MPDFETLIIGSGMAGTNPNVYAAGDVIGEPELMSKANYDGDLAVKNAFSVTATRRDYSVVVFAEYTMLIAASVGVTETGKDIGFMKVQK